MSDTAHDPTGDEARALAVDAVRRAGLDPTGARVIRRGSAIVVECPAADVIARVDRQEALARRQWRAARLFDRCGAPVMRLATPAPPLVDHRGAVTLWRRLEPGPNLGSVALGGLLRATHDRCRAERIRALTDTPPVLDPFLIVDDLFTRLPAWLSPARRAALEAERAALRARWTTLGDDPLGDVLVHGDVHEENVMRADGQPAFIDLELSGLGPASWDFVPRAASVRRYGRDPADYAAFLEAYGVDPADWSPHAPRWPGFTVACRVYELFCVVWTLASSADPARRREGELRLAGLLDGGHGRWTLA